MVKVLLAAIATMTVLVVLVGAGSPYLPEHHGTDPVLERPWLSAEAAGEIVGPDGALGPLFDGITIGGPAPSRETRARISEFARANHVDIDFDVVDDELVAVRFDVTFGGCCGYEGADMLALRMRRPRAQACCGCEKSWVNSWAVTSETGVHMRVRVRVNRMLVRWEKTLALPELFARAESLVGKRASTVARTAGEHWKEVEAGHVLLETPYPFVRYLDVASDPGLRGRDDLGLQVRVEAGVITEVSFVLRDFDAESPTDAMEAHWGRPRMTDDVRTWRRSDRTITADDRWKITIATAAR